MVGLHIRNSCVSSSAYREFRQRRHHRRQADHRLLLSLSSKNFPPPGITSQTQQNRLVALSRESGATTRSEACAAPSGDHTLLIGYFLKQAACTNMAASPNNERYSEALYQSGPTLFKCVWARNLNSCRVLNLDENKNLNQLLTNVNSGAMSLAFVRGDSRGSLDDLRALRPSCAALAYSSLD